MAARGPARRRHAVYPPTSSRRTSWAGHTAVAIGPGGMALTSPWRRCYRPVRASRALWVGLATWGSALLGAAASSLSLPRQGLLVAFEATYGVEYDSNQQVVSWSSQHDTHWSTARTNSSRHANRDQRSANSAIDATLRGDAHGLPGLAKTHEVDKRDLADARPMFHDRGDGLAALEFDGDDYLELPVAYQPRDGGLTLVALLRLIDDPTVSDQGTLHSQKRRPHSPRYWFGMGSPASSSDVQYSVSAIGSHIRVDVVPGNLLQCKKGLHFFMLLLVAIATLNHRNPFPICGPVAHDQKRPSVRRSARLRGVSAFDEDTLLSVRLDGAHVHARLDGNTTAFVGNNAYGGPISFEEDYGIGKAKSFIGSGPSAREHWLYTGEGARGMLVSLLIYSRALDESELRAAEEYVVCKHRHTGYFQGNTSSYLNACAAVLQLDQREL